MVSFQEVADFYLKYKGDPTKSAWVKFGDANKGFFTVNLAGNTEDAEDFNTWVNERGNPFIECLEAWVDGKGVIMTRMGEAFIVLEGTPLRLTNFKGLATLSSKAEWNVGDLLQVGFTEIENLVGVKPIQELPKDFKVVGGSWFDGDDDWAYTPWSKFVNESIGGVDTKDNLPIFLEFQLTDFDSLLNWKTTDSLRNLFGL
tara:strand:- start:628 stop:1230 length:603 start_codon:yes stop_codon:yes gene_type:complete